MKLLLALAGRPCYQVHKILGCNFDLGNVLETWILGKNMKVLFLCTGNSCRSIIAEALFNSMAPAGFSAQSAGSNPTGIVNPRAIEVLKKNGIPTDGLTSKSWNDLNDMPDLVITLCAEVAGEECPLFLGNVERLHWGMPDPAKVEGDEQTIAAAFSDTFENIRLKTVGLLQQVNVTPM